MNQIFHSLSTERTKLNLLSSNDFPDVLSMFQEEDTFKYIAPLKGKSEFEYRQFLLSRLQLIQNKKGYYWIARCLDTDEFIGAINLTPFQNNEKLQLGFQLKRKFWSKGYGFELSEKVLNHALSNLQLPIVYGFYQKENIASGKILHKLGFKYKRSKKELKGNAEINVCTFKPVESTILK
jgi:RimJ/RimL family protein N-acetyltransferase